MKKVILFCCLFCKIKAANALPMLDHPYPLPATFDGIISIYPDHENKDHPNKRAYWIIPSTARIVRNPDGTLQFGLVHSGISGFDPDGINMLLNVTIQPYIDSKTLQSAKKLITDADAKEGATSSFNFVQPTEETARLLVGGQPLDWNFSNSGATKIIGGSVDAGIPFQVEVNKSFDVRALTQAGGDNASTLGVAFTMKFSGIGDRVHAIVTAHFHQAYNHFKAAVKASGWFGLVQAQASTEWQNLKSEDWVHVEIKEGRKGQVDSLLPKLILDQLMNALASRTGAFARQLKPNGLSNADAPGGGGAWGWGFSSGTAFENVDETSDLSVDIDINYTLDHEIAFGMSFPSGGPELIKYIKNITNTNKPYPTSEDFANIRRQNQVCRGNNVASLKKLRDEGTISAAQYEKYFDKAFNNGCNVDYGTSTAVEESVEKSSPLLHRMVHELINAKTNKNE